MGFIVYRVPFPINRLPDTHPELDGGRRDPMKGPVSLIRSEKIPNHENLGPILEWSEGKAYLVIDRIAYQGKAGAILCYCNPPVHQVGNPGLDAYLDGLDRVFDLREDLAFLILYGANDPVHAGGDLKESLTRLDNTLKLKGERAAAGASDEEIDQLFDWADIRLKKGQALHGRIRKLSDHMRVVAICGGGTRFGGSAEIPLMADYLVGDSRSAMCFSEAMIGLIPGWAGIARSLIKAGLTNTEYMAKTSREVNAEQLKAIGIYNEVVPVPFPFPRRERTDDPEADKKRYLEALDSHDQEVGLMLLPKGLELSTCPEGQIPVLSQGEKVVLATTEEIAQEVNRRKDPNTYSDLWGRPLKEVKEEMGRLGRPLAPQSIAALEALVEGYNLQDFDEIAFVEREMKADARLYRDPRFRSGLIATLEQSVANYSE
jgi:enoyl-CoA hydratase/carnithine racemase